VITYESFGRRLRSDESDRKIEKSEWKNCFL
jgi:hypothetical protein